MSALPELAATALAAHVKVYREASIPAVVVPSVITAEGAESLRARLSAAGLHPFFLAHRGRYAYSDTHAEPALFGGLTALAEHLSGARLSLAGARWTRLVQGDYALMSDDAAPREPGIELALDVSEAASGGAEVCYCHRGQLFFAAPQEPGSLALVERGPTVRRYERYLSHRVGEAEIVRLRLDLRFI